MDFLNARHLMTVRCFACLDKLESEAAITGAVLLGDYSYASSPQRKLLSLYRTFLLQHCGGFTQPCGFAHSSLHYESAQQFISARNPGSDYSPEQFIAYLGLTESDSSDSVSESENEVVGSITPPILDESEEEPLGMIPAQSFVLQTVYGDEIIDYRTLHEAMP